MARRLIVTLLLTAVIPAVVLATPREREYRLHPKDVAASPSYVQRVEPAIVAVRVRSDPNAASSARLGSRRFASGIIFDTRGYVVTVTYALTDAVSIEVQMRDGRTGDGRLVGLDLESGLGVVKLAGDGPWPAARLGESRDVTSGMLTGTVGVDEDNDLVQVTGAVHAVRRFSSFWEYMLDRAFIVSPSSPAWGGSAVVNAAGEVIGVASLRLGDPPHVNLAIPIEKFTPVKDELIATGRVMSRRPRPWLGLYTAAIKGGADTYQGRGLIADPIHQYILYTRPGGIPGEATEQDIIDTPWAQRLRRIPQLQSARWVFPAAEHSRFQHSLGAMHLAGRLAQQLYPSLRAIFPYGPSAPLLEELLRMAGLLHDVGHGPFGHFFDDNFLIDYDLTHELVGQRIIREELGDIIRNLRRSPTAAFNADERIDPEWICYLMGKSYTHPLESHPKWLPHLKPLLSGVFTADNMDYALRDSYMCGVAVGPIDIERIIYYSFFSEKGLPFDRRRLL